MSVAPAVGAAGWAFLLLAGVLLPIATAIFAQTERRRAAAAGLGGDRAVESGPTRIALYAQILVTHAVLFGGAIAVARAEGIELFPTLRISLRDVVAAGVALIGAISVAELYWRSRSPVERERLWVRRILPQTASERWVWVLVSAGAAVAEETAYRGVFVAIMSAATGSFTIAIVASAVAFAVVHAPQGFAGIVYVFVIALVHQVLILVTGTLLLAILVHFTYDVLAGLWLPQRHGLTKRITLDT